MAAALMLTACASLGPDRPDVDVPLRLEPERVFETAVLRATFTDAGPPQRSGTIVQNIAGPNRREETHVTFANGESKGSTMLETPAFTYRWNHGSDVGAKTTNAMALVRARYAELGPDEQRAFRKRLARERARGGLNGVIPGAPEEWTEEEILGRTCQVVRLGPMRVHFWKEGGWLALRSEFPGTVMEVTEIEENVPIPDAAFEPPRDVAFETDADSEAVVRRWADELFTWLHTGERPAGMASPGP